MTIIINGKELSNRILEEIKQEIQHLSHIGTPKIAVIQVGSREDSNIYIRKKQEACKKVGIHSKIYSLEATSAVGDINKLIEELNSDSNVHGILVQLPLPDHLDEEEILGKISHEKDVDGFHAYNMGNLAMTGRSPKFIPCTPLGCLEILKRNGIQIKGKHAVVVGKSNIVGLPMALLLMNELATVTVCHKDTEDIQGHLRRADIIISACGQATMIKRDWVKEGVVIIDVGINCIPDSTRRRGYRIVGDVDFNNVKDKSAAITPVPGGVGPMTVAMLLQNSLNGFKSSKGI